MSAIGASILAIYFVPALCLSLWEYIQQRVPHDLGAMLTILMALLVTLSFWFAVGHSIVFNRLHKGSPDRPTSR